ncbi:MAG: tRNA (N6-isopentenyl adenosine(37)-C2)-methylthiotransferase MiaB [Eubacteriales bacterium]|nr:tRNA (N6-isopentenyl adenosine(37)-C2)-methylthiotransferase MiaB [Eubacteriales bacterium]
MNSAELYDIFQAAPAEEPARQYYFIEHLSVLLKEHFDALLESGEAERRYGTDGLSRMRAEKRYATCSVVTFGCQMNARDSEKILGTLLSAGFSEAEDAEQADFVLFNTCTVRENANEHLYGRLGRLKQPKKAKPDMIVAICGCMMQEEDEVIKVQEKYPYVDIIFGTHNVYSLAELLFRLYMNRADVRKKKAKERRVIDVREEADRIVEELPNARKYAFKQGVNISFGCNNFCTYCIVPYVRGRERSRRSEDILAEIRKLSREGVVEIMLLGQNVNSYGNDDPDEISFPELLRRVCRIDGIERVRFMTPHPKDLSDDLITVMAEEPKICRHLHLPVQSGSSRILKAMNRRYTKENYLTLVKKIRERVPEVSLTTDIIVGFPGETEADFEDTIDVVKEARYDSAYTFIYSKRTGTPAARMEDQVPEEVVKERFARLLSVIDEISAEESGKDAGKIMDVLVEDRDEGREGFLTGRLSNNVLVHFPGKPSLIGKIVNVKLTEAKGFYYIGELADGEVTNG